MAEKLDSSPLSAVLSKVQPRHVPAPEPKESVVDDAGFIYWYRVRLSVGEPFFAAHESSADTVENDLKTVQNLINNTRKNDQTMLWDSGQVTVARHVVNVEAVEEAVVPESAKWIYSDEVEEVASPGPEVVVEVEAPVQPAKEV